MGDVFGGGKYFGASLVGSIVNAVLVTLGFVLCIVPGVIVALGICMYGQFIVDRKLSGADAIKASWELTKGHKVPALRLWASWASSSPSPVHIACFVGAIFDPVPSSSSRFVKCLPAPG